MRQPCAYKQPQREAETSAYCTYEDHLASNTITYLVGRYIVAFCVGESKIQNPCSSDGLQNQEDPKIGGSQEKDNDTAATEASYDNLNTFLAGYSCCIYVRKKRRQQERAVTLQYNRVIRSVWRPDCCQNTFNPDNMDAGPRGSGTWDAVVGTMAERERGWHNREWQRERREER